MSIDSLWVQNLFKAFNTDDEELAIIALQSSLAEIQDVVTGGYYGSPFSIGEHGFYSESQFQVQAALLCDTERINSDQKFYLSDKEWNTVDHFLTKVAHYSNSKFEKVCRGDTFCSLAIKKNAFSVAAFLLKAGVDPLVANEEEEDLFDIVKQQYKSLTVKMRELSIEMKRLQSTGSGGLKSEWGQREALENILLIALEGLLVFLAILKENLEKRLLQIEDDKKALRRCELLHEAMSESKLWNITQETKVLRYIQEIDSLSQHVTEKTFSYKQPQKRKEAVKSNKQHIQHLHYLLATNNGALDTLQLETEVISNKISVGEDGTNQLRDAKQRKIRTPSERSESEQLSQSSVSSTNMQASKGGHEHLKPLLGTLKITADMIISYR
jgi:hypothetical protein